LNWKRKAILRKRTSRRKQIQIPINHDEIYYSQFANIYQSSQAFIMRTFARPLAAKIIANLKP